MFVVFTGLPAALVGYVQDSGGQPSSSLGAAAYPCSACAGVVLSLDYVLHAVRHECFGMCRECSERVRESDSDYQPVWSEIAKL